MDKSYEKIAHLLVDEKKAQPSQVMMSEKEQAKSRKAKLERLAKMNGNINSDSEDGDNASGMKKREAKLLDKRE